MEGDKSVKVFVGVIILFLLFSGLGWYSEVLISKQAGEILTELENLASYVKKSKSLEIEKQLNIINKLWLKSRKVWVLLIDHQDLDEFEIYLARTKSYLENKAIVLALGGIAEMKQTINRIPDQLRLNLENIF
ncbi:MAG TPA: hypothetical protein DDW93_09845 [Firmicutes bacterium]|jgi:hypothetical protein|nr:hypothetical protein [Bacillota bacterium]HBK69392.1 hypothetical protein [Bacillota bacterium]HBT16262.1 hypothetical protein [Bacillota bacterium]